MKKFLFLLSSIFLSFQAIKSQPQIKGRPIAEIFPDFHYIVGDSTKTTGFGVTRAYLGYNFLTETDFSGTIILNVGDPEDLGAGDKHRRYSFFREASVSYNHDKLAVSFGITSTRSTQFQQKFIGKRYVADTYQAKNGYTYVADLGITADYTLNEFLKVDLGLFNGSGYNDIHPDNNIETSIGLTFTPVKAAVLRLYADGEKCNSALRNTFICFAGFKNTFLTASAEFSYKSQLDKVPGHNAWGFSGNLALMVLPNAEIFTRYDYSTSCVPAGEELAWNINCDGGLDIYGIQYTFNDYVKVAIDYQGLHPDAPGKKDSGAFYLNAIFKF